MNLLKKMKFYTIITNILKNIKSYLLLINFFKSIPTTNFLGKTRKIRNKQKIKPSVVIQPRLKNMKDYFWRILTFFKYNIFFNIKNRLYKLHSTHIFTIYYSITTHIFTTFFKNTFLFILLTIYVLFLLFNCLWFWSYWGPLFIKGDPIACPHYEKTYYYVEEYCCYYDFHPYFDEIKQNLKNDPKKAYYKWKYYFDWKDKICYKIEFFCVYNTGIEERIWIFDIEDILYTDKTKWKHYIPNLIECRIEENWMIGQHCEIEPELLEKENAIKRIYNEDGSILGWNINIGEIRYEFDIINYIPN